VEATTARGAKGRRASASSDVGADALTTKGGESRPSSISNEGQRWRPSDRLCARLLHGDGEVAVRFMMFDLLRVDGHSLLDTPYHGRRRLLEELDVNGSALVHARRVRRRRGALADRLRPRPRRSRREAADEHVSAGASRRLGEAEVADVAAARP
jgi:hypothetical protein